MSDSTEQARLRREMNVKERMEDEASDGLR